MEHVKQFYKQRIEKNGFTIEVLGPLTREELSKYCFHAGLVAFRRPSSEQFQALLSIAELAEARIIAAMEGNTIVGYVTFLYPDPLERWSEAKMQDLLELGAIEVAPPYRNLGLGKEMLRVAFMDDAMEDYIVITTEYYWHWDLKGTGLDVWQYRKIMERMMTSAGLKWYATDDPEICSHPANCLMARIGDRVPVSSIEAFDQIRFTNRFMY
ncbi:GNAT family N-acetyltransferase [Caldalkalibacillus mannanilyticus]|uniref:GNAT family N-acetyltransferase n=1 Tax=Caldalkalibacillus mannanilyticus TaxID=1418 RepID=UPI00046AF964|nr:GNAT family N-acetyltransferase [Caldalkalibacillus mannanilyticus]